MELETKIIKRISCKLSRQKPCDCKLICEEIADVSIDSKDIKKQNGPQNDTASTSND